MKISRLLGNPRTPLSVKQDAVLIPGLFIVNCFIFSPWLRILYDAPLMVMWLLGLISLLPLFWRDRAPVASFVIQWIIPIIAWPVNNLYAPVVGLPLALYAVAVHCDRKKSFAALLASFVPILFSAAVAFKNWGVLEKQLQGFFPNMLLLLSASLGSWVIGRASQGTQRQVQNLEQERETVQEAVAAERRKIIRELRDIVSETTGKKTIAELRRLLQILEIGRNSSRPENIGEFDVRSRIE